MSAGSRAHFETTRWTLIAAAGHDSDPQSQQALSELCQTYWFPLYAFLRRKGYQSAEAQDLTQAFFAELLEKDRLVRADPHRGRFRSFLLASLQNFLANTHRSAQAVKRGGGKIPWSIDYVVGEERYQREPAHDLTPERIFDRRWALELIELATQRLRAEWAEAGKTPLLEWLLPYLGGDTGLSYQEIGDRVGLTEGAVKVAAHRLRQQFRTLLRAEIAQTVAIETDIDDELRSLFQALDSGS